MALLSNYSSTNLVITEGKTVSYSKSRIYGSWSYTSGTAITTYTEAWEFHRYCSMSFEYVGMTYSAAKSCAEALVSKYTRSFKLSEWDSSQGVFVSTSGGDMPMASVSVSYDGGSAYSVRVSVREDDTRISRAAPSEVSSLFSAENSRSYEEY